MDLADISRPVREDLAAVEEGLKSVGKVSSPGLSELLGYTLKGGGKRARPILALLCGRLCGAPGERVVPMAVAAELTHLATLVHDDTIDKSPVRWSRPTPNTLWGEEQAVLLGDYLFARAGELTASTDNLRVIKLLPETLMIITGGEIAQSRSAFQLDQTRAQYLQRVSSKTAALFTLATASGAILAGAREEWVQALSAYGHNFGIAFQIVDDILDFIGTEEEMGKPVGSDLAHGTLTLPAMLLMEQYPQDNPVTKLFRERGGAEYVRQAVELVRGSSIIDQCFDVAAEYRDQACLGLQGLPDNEYRQSLYDLADFIITRRK